VSARLIVKGRNVGMTVAGVFVGRARGNRTPARKGFAFVSLVAKGRNAVGMVAVGSVKNAR